MTPTPGPGPFDTLRKFMRPRPPAERCELCGKELTPEHPHLLELTTRKVACSCDPCAILFSDRQNPLFRRIPRTVEYLQGFQMTDALWNGLGIPINLAFFFRDSRTDKVTALYPSPAGATEATLALDAWPELVVQNPVLAELESDVEALLVDRMEGRRDHYRAPVDECYRLVGLIRAHWRGLSGGAAVWEQVGRFFAGLRERSSPAE
jgi:Family of unknown function (DUF5947)